MVVGAQASYFDAVLEYDPILHGTARIRVLKVRRRCQQGLERREANVRRLPSRATHKANHERGGRSEPEERRRPLTERAQQIEFISGNDGRRPRLPAADGIREHQCPCSAAYIARSMSRFDDHVSASPRVSVGNERRNFHRHRVRRASVGAPALAASSNSRNSGEVLRIWYGVYSETPAFSQPQLSRIPDDAERNTSHARDALSHLVPQVGKLSGRKVAIKAPGRLRREIDRRSL